MIFAGIDEAGYGPTLGPLVVAATAFRIPEDLCAGEAPDLWELLSASTARKPAPGHVAVNDSKKIYTPKKGIRHLEETALSFLEAASGGKEFPAALRPLIERLSGAEGSSGYLEEYPWYRGRDLALPRATYANQIHLLAAGIVRDLRARGIELAGIRAVPMEVLEFNGSLDRLENKARVSFQIVGSLLARLWKTFPAERIVARVDRQGGRMHYGPLLFGKIHPRGIRIVAETEELSSYELVRGGQGGQGGREGGGAAGMRVEFAVGCEESSFPVALASIFCKYLRELHMAVFNSFWTERVDGLRPTAGYALDARRFLRDISAARASLRVDDAALIRKR